ncbi:MAG: PLP-dependent aminotransferase family protein [Dehalococcoidia bacterium]
MTVDSEHLLAEEVARLWAARDLDELTTPGAKFLTTGSATDWGMVTEIESAVPPITLGGGIPDPVSLPRQALVEAMARAVATEDGTDDGALRYGGPEGYEPLREALAARYTRDRGFPVSAANFLLTNGSAGAIDQICSAFISPGDVIITEAPTFSGTLRTFRGHEAVIEPVGMDEQGMLVDDLEPLIERLTAEGKHVKLIYTISNFHNPMGVTMSLARREALIRVAARHGAFILDDDAYGELHFPGWDRPPALSALSGCNGVITVGTFSKVIATGLRVGWVHTTPEIIDRITRVRFEMGNSPLLHRMLYEFMKDGKLDEHIARMQELYLSKLDTLCDALREYCEPYLTFRRPHGGFFLWVDLQEGLDGREVQQAAIAEGLIAAAGYGFYPDRMDAGNHMRLAYSWVAEDDLREAARRLGVACSRVAERGEA